LIGSRATSDKSGPSAANGKSNGTALKIAAARRFDNAPQNQSNGSARSSERSITATNGKAAAIKTALSATKKRG
jgi:hypothetical protein